jgi:drug/metabolite transporter (DMT)-like permease
MPSTNSKNLELGSVLVVISSLFYATYGVWTKLIGDSFGGYSASAVRSLVVVAVLFPAALILKKVEPLKLKQNYKAILGLTLFSCLIWGPLYYAVLKAGIGVALSVAYAAIVIGGLIFGRIFNKEPLTKFKLASLLLAMIGLSLMYSPKTSDITILPILAACLGGLASSANSVIIKKIDYGATQATLVMWYTSIIANISMAIILRENIQLSFGVNYLYIFLFAVSSILSTLAMVKALKFIDLGLAGILGLTEIIFGVLFGIIFFHEKLSISQITGIIVIIGVCALPYADKAKLKCLKKY